MTRADRAALNRAISARLTLSDPDDDRAAWDFAADLGIDPTAAIRATFDPDRTGKRAHIGDKGQPWTPGYPTTADGWLNPDRAQVRALGERERRG